MVLGYRRAYRLLHRQRNCLGTGISILQEVAPPIQLRVVPHLHFKGLPATAGQALQLRPSAVRIEAAAITKDLAPPQKVFLHACVI